MKEIYLIMTMLLSLAVPSFCQNESVIYLKGVDFSFYNMKKEIYPGTGETKTEKLIIYLEDVRTVNFLKNDSLAFSINKGAPVYSRLSEIIDVDKYKNHFSPVLGTAIGVVGGALLGGIIGNMTSGGLVFSKSEMTSWGILIGGLGGGLIGAIITFAVNEINHETLDLFSVPDKVKMNKLMKFLKDK